MAPTPLDLPFNLTGFPTVSAAWVDLTIRIYAASDIRHQKSTKCNDLKGSTLSGWGKGVCCRPCCLVFAASSILSSLNARTARASLTRALSLRNLRPRTFNRKYILLPCASVEGEITANSALRRKLLSSMIRC